MSRFIEGVTKVATQTVMFACMLSGLDVLFLGTASIDRVLPQLLTCWALYGVIASYRDKD